MTNKDGDVRESKFGIQPKLRTQNLAVSSIQTQGKAMAVAHHVSQALKSAVKQHSIESTVLLMGMVQAPGDELSAETVQSFLTMISKRTLNPADVNRLYQASICAFFTTCSRPTSNPTRRRPS